MKVARSVLKVTALGLAIAAAACCVIAFWDKILAGVTTAKEKVQARRSHCADGCCADYEDYADWDE